MTTATKVQKESSAGDIERYDSKMSKIRKRIKERKPELDKCLNADYAARVEAQKPMFDYEVSATINSRKEGRMRSERRTQNVTAQNEDTAWAMFCDLTQAWPAPNSCDRTIKKV